VPSHYSRANCRKIAPACVSLSGAPIFQAADKPKLVGIVSEGAA
jgi:hypothetical protein